MANLGMIGGVKPDGVSYWQSLDGSGRAHAANPEYKDYSQLFREYTFEARPGYVPVGQRDGRTVYAAPDYMRGEDGNYVNVSAADAERIARERGSLIPTRDEYKALTEQAKHIPMPTFPNGVGDNAVYTQRVGDVSGPVVHGKEFFGSGNVDAVNYWANAKTAKPAQSAGMNLRDGIIATAQELGIDPLDLATVISYETGGTFDPLQRGPTTQWGQHRGLIQFGEPQAQRYGVNWDDPLASQLGPDGAIVKYLRASGFQNGMSGMDLYSTINAGAPGRYGASDANNGGAPGDVRDKWMNQMADHRRKAAALLGGKFTPGTNTPKPAKGAYQPGQSSGATYGNVQPGAVSGAYAYGPEPVKNALAQNPYYDPRMNALAQWEEASRIEPLQTPMIDPRSMRVW